MGDYVKLKATGNIFSDSALVKHKGEKSKSKPNLG